MNGTRQTSQISTAKLRPTWRQLGVATGFVGSVALVAFHAALLWTRIRDLTILEPLVALEWLAGLLMMAVLWHLRRQSVPLFRGRRALAFWLLVLLLHFIAAPPAVGSLSEPEGLLVALPAASALVWIGLLVLVRLGAARLRPHLVAARRRRGPPSGRSATSTGHPFQLFARPPPLHASI